MGAAQLEGLFRIQCCVDTAIHDPGSAFTRHASDLHAAQSIAGMDADAHNVAGLYAIGLNLFKRLIRDQQDRRTRAGVAAASTYSQRGVITPIPNEVSLGLTR